MAVIQISSDIRGSADTKAAAGLCMSASAQCFGLSDAATAQRVQAEQKSPTEPEKPKG